MADNIRKFDVTNHSAATRVMWEPWGTVSCFKILTYLSAAHSDTFSARYLAEVLDEPLANIIRALKLLKSNSYIVEIDGFYYLSTALKAEDLEDDPKMDQRSKNGSEPIQKWIASDPKMDQKRSKNGSQIIINNNNKNNNKQIKARAPVLEIPDWILKNLDLHKSLLDWIAQRRQRRQAVSQLALNRILKKYHEQPERFYAALEHSIACDYQGVFDPPKQRGGGQPKQSNAEKSVQAAQNILNRMAQNGF